MFENIDAHARVYWYLWLFNRWMAIRLNVVGAGFAILVAAVVVSVKGIDAALAGFALSFALQYSTAVVSKNQLDELISVKIADPVLDMDHYTVGYL